MRTLNARGLFHPAPGVRRRRFEGVERIARQANVVLLLGTHATDRDFASEGAALVKGFWWSASTSHAARAGGLLTVVREVRLGDREQFSKEGGLDAQVAHVRLAWGGSQVIATTSTTMASRIAPGGDLNFEIGGGDALAERDPS